MAKASKEVPRNKFWDYERDIHSHLLRKNKILASATEEKSNYFSTLLEDFVAPCTRSGTREKELVPFMDSVYCIVKSHLLCLPEPNNDDTAAEENCKEEEEEDDDGGIEDSQYRFFLDNWRPEEEDDDDSLIEDPTYKFFLNNLRPDGKFYVLELTEENVFVKYHDESSTPDEALNVCATENANLVSNEANLCEQLKPF